MSLSPSTPDLFFPCPRSAACSRPCFLSGPCRVVHSQSQQTGSLRSDSISLLRGRQVPTPPSLTDPLISPSRDSLVLWGLAGLAYSLSSYMRLLPNRFQMQYPQEPPSCDFWWMEIVLFACSYAALIGLSPFYCHPLFLSDLRIWIFRYSETIGIAVFRPLLDGYPSKIFLARSLVACFSRSALLRPYEPPFTYDSVKQPLPSLESTHSKSSSFLMIIFASAK